MVVSLLLVLLISSVTSDATEGCVKGTKNKNTFKKLFNNKRNALLGVFCKDQQLSCNDVALKLNEDGFYGDANIACGYFNEYVTKTNMLAIFSKVVLDSGTFVYPQVTQRTGLFLTKTFGTVTEITGVKINTLVEAVIPQHKTQPSSAALTATCHKQVDDAPITDGVDGVEVYCIFSCTCGALKRTCSQDNDNLKLRTPTTTFVNADDANANVAYTTDNEVVFLAKDDEYTCDCDVTGGSIVWYDNSVKISGETGANYVYTHEEADTIIQCIVSGGPHKIVTWNVLTVERITQDATVKDTDVKHDVAHTFSCTGNTALFPAPLYAAWKWENTEGAGATDKETVTNAKAPNFEYTATLKFEDNGYFKCYLSNGVGSGELEVLVANYKTKFVVDAEVQSLVPVPVRWYEYITTVPEVYYIRGDPITLTCQVAKESDYEVFWMIPDKDNLYYYDKGKTKKVDLTDISATWKESLQAVEELSDAAQDPWVMSEELVEGTLELYLAQTISLDKYLDGMKAEEKERKLKAMCFLVYVGAESAKQTDHGDGSGASPTDTVGKLKMKVDQYLALAAKGETEDEETEETKKLKKLFKTLTIRFFSYPSRPSVKGPLHQINNDSVAKLTMNCVTDGIPPTFIYFMYNKSNKTTNEFNLTAELAKPKKELFYLRFIITRESDTKTVLTILTPDEEYEGFYTCWAINRATDQEFIPGVDAEVIIEDACTPESKFQFYCGAGRVEGAVGLLVVVLLLQWWGM